MSRATGGPAFPARFMKYEPGEIGNEVAIFEDHSGMTLRDHFAGKALQGFIACHTGSETCTPQADHSAARAYEYADAMLAERAK